MNSTVVPSFHFGMNHQGIAAARPTCPVYDAGRKTVYPVVISESIVLLLHPHVDVPYSLVVT